MIMTMAMKLIKLNLMTMTTTMTMTMTRTGSKLSQLQCLRQGRVSRCTIALRGLAPRALPLHEQRMQRVSFADCVLAVSRVVRDEGEESFFFSTLACLQ